MIPLQVPLPGRKNADHALQGSIPWVHTQWQPFLLSLLDSAMVFGSFFLAYWLRNGLIYHWTKLRFIWTSNHLVFLSLFSGLMWLVFYCLGLYKEYVQANPVQRLSRLVKGVGLQSLFLITAAYYGRVQLLLESRILVSAFIFLLFVLLLLNRVLIFPRLCFCAWRLGLGVRRVLLVGDSQPLSQIEEYLRESFPRGKRVVASVGLESVSIADPAGGVTEGAPPKDSPLQLLLRDHRIQEAYVCAPSLPPHQSVDVVTQCKAAGVILSISAQPFGIVKDKLDVTFYAGGHRFLTFSRSVTEPLERLLKRAFDWVTAGLLLVLLCPWLLILAVAIRWGSRGPALFRQVRTGRNGVPFTMYKFRTMPEGSDTADHEAASKAFVENDQDFFRKSGAKEEDVVAFKAAVDTSTPLGRLLRRTSLDELAQLINVMKGEMSLVGPRPVPVYESRHYRPWHWRRLDVRPGITGLWQVTARSRCSHDEMVLLDLYYVLNWSLALDVFILLRTLPAIFSGKGAH